MALWSRGLVVWWSGGRSALGTPPSPVPGRPFLTLVGLGPTPHTVAAASCSPRIFTRQSVSRVREWAPLCCAWTTKAGVSQCTHGRRRTESHTSLSGSDMPARSSKVQGATLKHITLWLDFANMPAAAYVALSRVELDENWRYSGTPDVRHFTLASF